MNIPVIYQILAVAFISCKIISLSNSYLRPLKSVIVYSTQDSHMDGIIEKGGLCGSYVNVVLHEQY